MSRWSSSSTSSVETIGGELEQVHHRHHLQDGKEIVENRVKSPSDPNIHEHRKYSGGSHAKSDKKTRKLNGKEKRSSPDGSRDKKYRRHSKDSDDRHNNKHRDSHDKSYEKRKYSDKEKKYHELKRKDSKTDDSEIDTSKKYHTHAHHHQHHHRHSLESDKNKNYSDENDTSDKGVQIHAKGHRHHRRHHTRHYIDKRRLLPPDPDLASSTLPPSPPPTTPPPPPVQQEEKRIIHVKDDTTSVSRVLKRESLTTQNPNQNYPPPPPLATHEEPEEKVKIIHVTDDTTSVSRVLKPKSSIITPECPVCPVKSKSKQQIFISPESETDTETEPNRELYSIYSESEPEAEVESFLRSDSSDINTLRKRERREIFIVPKKGDPRTFIPSESESDPRRFYAAESEPRRFNTADSDGSNFIPPESQPSVFVGGELESRRELSQPKIFEMSSSVGPTSDEVVPFHREASVVSETREQDFHQAEVGERELKELKDGDTCPFCGRGKILKKFTWTGIIAAILLFPCGLYCCFKCRALKCSYCGASP